jgi:hypothetical protein
MLILLKNNTVLETRQRQALTRSVEERDETMIAFPSSMPFAELVALLRRTLPRTRSWRTCGSSEVISTVRSRYWNCRLGEADAAPDF